MVSAKINVEMEKLWDSKNVMIIIYKILTDVQLIAKFNKIFNAFKSLSILPHQSTIFLSVSLLN